MFAGRLRIVFVLLTVLVAGIFARAAHLHLFHGDDYRQIVQERPVRKRLLNVTRARIASSDGQTLAEDRPRFDLSVAYPYLRRPLHPRWVRRQIHLRKKSPGKLTPEQRLHLEARVQYEVDSLWVALVAVTHERLDALRARAADVQASVERARAGVNRARRRRGLSAIGPNDLLEEETVAHPLLDHVPLEVVAAIEADPGRFPGVQITEGARRVYPQGALAGHVLGYVGSIAPGDLPAFRDRYPADDLKRYLATDRVGVAGLEKALEDRMRGARGQVTEMVTARRDVCRRLQHIPPVQSPRVVLTLDTALQRRAEEILDGPSPDSGQRQQGAIVVMDVHTGALRALASAPRFDSNAMTSPTVEQLDALRTHPGKPFLHRATTMCLPPGSVFKVVTAIAALQTGAIRTDTVIECRGWLHSPDRAPRCWIYKRYGCGHGRLDLVEAIERSCNIFFMVSADRVVRNAGPAGLSHWARRLGLGAPVGLCLPEASGSVPSPHTARRGWSSGDTHNLAIGQGRLLVTPVQVARLLCVVANGGRHVHPHLVQSRARPAEPIPGLRPETLQVVRRGLQRVVQSKDGTAHAYAYIDGLSYGAKTGTAQSGRGKDHAWFAGFVPSDHPRLAFAVAIESGGSGSHAAAPLARQLLLWMRDRGTFAADPSR